MQTISILKVVGGVALTLGVFASIVGGYAFTVTKQQQLISTTIEEDLSGTVADVATAAHIRQSIQSLQFSEEVMAQSARDFALTDEEQWQTQYVEARQNFGRALEEVQDVNVAAGQAELGAIVDSAKQLAAMSAGAIELVEGKRANEALNVLNGAQYATHKETLQSKITNYSAIHNEQLGTALGRYESGIEQATQSTKDIVYWSIALTGLTLLTSLTLGGILMQLRSQSWKRFAKSVREMVADDLKERVTPPPDATVGPLANQINALADKVAYSTGQSAAILDASHDALLIVDDDGIVRSANAAALNIMQIPQSELVGKSVDELRAIYKSNL